MLKKAIYILITLMIAFSLMTGCAKKQEENIQSQNTDTKKAQEAESENPFSGELKNILLMGSMNGDFSDENIQNYALTHILITLDPDMQEVRFTTFPYNLKVKPVLEDGGAEETQLQFVYAQYGADVLMNTFKARFNVDIDGWVIMNMDGVNSIVDRLGGLKIDVKDLSVNEMSQTVEDILGYVWHEIKSEGMQVLNGVQISGYFMDTYNGLDEENPLIDEEERFRSRHEEIIDALINAVSLAEVDEKRASEIAKSISETFDTNIKERQWEDIAELALYCIEGGHDYLHIPIDIQVEKEGSMQFVVYSRDTDVDAVKDFVYAN